jgi:hypothetical protein
MSELDKAPTAPEVCAQAVGAPEAPPAPLMDQYLQILSDPNNRAMSYRVGDLRVTEMGPDDNRFKVVQTYNQGNPTLLEIENIQSGQRDIHVPGHPGRASSYWISRSADGSFSWLNSDFRSGGALADQWGTRFSADGSVRLGFRYDFNADNTATSCRLNRWTNGGGSSRVIWRVGQQ